MVMGPPTLTPHHQRGPPPVSSFEDILFGTPTPPTPTTTHPAPTANGVSNTDLEPYTRTALTNELHTLATTTTGSRNHALNIAALKLGALPAINRQHLRTQLLNACTTNGLLTDDGPAACNATIDSAFRKADDTPRTIPDRSPKPTHSVVNGTTPITEPDPNTSAFGDHPPHDAAHYLFDTDDITTALWGDGDNILWAEGEALMIAGGMGLGKTTLAGQLIRAQLGLPPGDVLGLPVTEITGPILYLAMDRPRQIRRSMLRQFDPTERDHISGRLLIRTGPPIADLATNPALLNRMAAEANAQVVYIDSLKDAAIGLSDDKVGAAYNRARQMLLNDNRQTCELHHNRKAIAGTTPTGSVSDIYGSTWLTSGAGSVITLTGEPGDPIIEMRHVKQPMNEVGPYRLLHNHTAGLMTIEHQVDLLVLAQANRTHGLTAQAAAGALFDTDKPTRAQVEKARYRMDRLAQQGLLQRVDGMKGGQHGAGAAAWYPTND